LSLISLSESGLPGIVVSLSQNSAQTITHQDAPILASIVRGTKFADVSGGADGLDYKAHNLVVKTFTISSVTTSFANGSTDVELDCVVEVGGSLEVGKKIFGKFVKIFSSGFTAQTSKASTKVTISLLDKNSRPQVTVTGSNFNVPKWNIHVSKYL